MFVVDRLLIKRVQAEPDLEGFNCGNGSINKKIRDGYYLSLLKQAYAYEICIEDAVIGHYRVSIATFDYEDEDYNVDSVENKYSAVKVDYLAIDLKSQNRGNGTAVLEYITKWANKYSTSIPIRFLALDALREKVSWYQNRGFKVYEDAELNRNTETVAMYMDFCDAETLKAYCDSLLD